MNRELPQLIDESIKLEQNVAELYRIFSKSFPEDFDFWRKLQSEEKKHATLIQDAKIPLLTLDMFPSELLSSSLKALIETNERLDSLLKEYNEIPPSREIAFNVAIDIEQSAGEIHYNSAMQKSPTSGMMKVFQDLTDGDTDHSNRIRIYMSDNEIEKSK
ncbi:MAG: rubrerythrin family protein [Thermodesulfobacteriota bacterium]|nr:rubrerythrin family protein [Thermodesulfobacteriota bacterium]